MRGIFCVYWHHTMFSDAQWINFLPFHKWVSSKKTLLVYFSIIWLQSQLPCYLFFLLINFPQLNSINWDVDKEFLWEKHHLGVVLYIFIKIVNEFFFLKIFLITKLAISQPIRFFINKMSIDIKENSNLRTNKFPFLHKLN